MEKKLVALKENKVEELQFNDSDNNYRKVQIKKWIYWKELEGRQRQLQCRYLMLLLLCFQHKL